MASKNILIVALIAIFLVLAIMGAFLINDAFVKKNMQSAQTAEVDYNPQINPDDFSAKIDNRYLTFVPGTKYTYKGETEEGTEVTEVYVTDKIKSIMGVDVLEVQDRVWLDGDLIEDTRDWYAQDKYGNVWYFGEDSKEIVNGKVASTKGSWVAGVYGAKPGIVMEANPVVGDTYRQEYFKGEAEDMAEVVALGMQIKVGYGAFSDCLQTRDWNPLEPGNDEYKYYCPEVGGLVYEVGIEDGEGVQLISLEKDFAPAKASEADKPMEMLKTGLTEQEAVAIARREVAGIVTDVAIENKFGRPAYVVEIDAEAGPETDVVIDVETGEILGIER